MHFQIIEISDEPISKDKWVSDFTLYEDATIAENTDYVGDLYNEEERKGFIRDSLPVLFKGIADVDLEKETITFKSKEECRRTLLEEKKKILDIILEDMIDKGNCSFYPLRNYGKDYKDWPQLFYRDGGLTSAQFIEDAPYYAGKTMYIGAIYDAHY